MVNVEYVNFFGSELHKELEGQMSGPPTIMPGGESVDHYKGLASNVAARVIPFSGQKYQATEFLYGWIPLSNPGMPYLYFQCPVLDVKGKNIPGNIHAVAWVHQPIPTTIVTPMVGLTNRYLPMSAIEQGARPKDVFKNKIQWTALLEALNADKQAIKANTPKNYSTEMTQIGFGGTYKTSVDVGGAEGLTQLAPYRGFTIITQQRPPAPNANINKPRYAFDEIAQKLSTIAAYVTRYPQQGEDIGQQMLTQGNAAVMDLVYKQIDQVAGAAAAARAPPPVVRQLNLQTQNAMACPNCHQPVDAEMVMCPSCGAELRAPPAAPAPAPAAPSAERVPCPTCSQPIGIGWKFCPKCKTPLVWQ